MSKTQAAISVDERLLKQVQIAAIQHDTNVSKLTRKLWREWLEKTGTRTKEPAKEPA